MNDPITTITAPRRQAWEPRAKNRTPPDDVYEELRKHFSDDECVKITTAIGAINVWNRLAVAFRAQHPIDAAKAAA